MEELLRAGEVVEDAEGEDQIELPVLVDAGALEVENECLPATPLHLFDMLGAAVGRRHVEAELDEGVAEVAEPGPDLEDAQTPPALDVDVSEEAQQPRQ